MHFKPSQIIREVVSFRFLVIVFGVIGGINLVTTIRHSTFIITLGWVLLITLTLIYVWRFDAPLRRSILRYSNDAPSTRVRRVVHSLVTFSYSLPRIFLICLSILIALHLSTHLSLYDIPPFLLHLLGSCTLITGVLSTSFARHQPLNRVTETNQHRVATLGWRYWLTSTAVVLVFIAFGVVHLGKFMSVDGPKWLDTRVPQLTTALSTGNWLQTAISDKPGVLPAILAGIFQSTTDYRDAQTIAERVDFLFWWRLPIILFNAGMLFVIALLAGRLFGKQAGFLSVLLIALHPVLIGMSQVINPDATLWSVATASFLAFTLYLTTEQRRYVVWSGVFLGLGLITKYFIAIFFVTYFLSIYLWHNLRNEPTSALIRHSYNLCCLYGIAIGTYTLLYPAAWLNPTYIISGTIGAAILAPGSLYALIFLLCLSSDVILGDEAAAKWLRTRINIASVGLQTITIGFAALTAFIGINAILQDRWFNFNHYVFQEFIKGVMANASTFLASWYTTFFTAPVLILAGWCLITLVAWRWKEKRLPIEQQFIILSICITGLIFLLGSTLGGFIAETRYQIILYPLSACGAAVIFVHFFGARRNLLLSIMVIGAFIAPLRSLPFYYHYTNIFNLRHYTITEAWGFGGYELAQILNTLPNAESLTAWVDREGFRRFFIGRSYWRGDVPLPFTPNGTPIVDYLILTSGGERILNNALQSHSQGPSTLFYKYLAEKTPILHYYTVPPDYQVCILNNPNDCIRAVAVPR